MKEIIGKCEQRISQLRSMLIHKQAELNYIETDLGRESLPKKENMQIFNSLASQSRTITKYLKEQKKLHF